MSARHSPSLRSELFGDDLTSASVFFRQGAYGISPGRHGLESVNLQPGRWHMTPLQVDRFDSSWFDDRSIFPAGSASLDSGCLMIDIPAEWRKATAPCR